MQNRDDLSEQALTVVGWFAALLISAWALYSLRYGNAWLNQSSWNWMGLILIGAAAIPFAWSAIQKAKASPNSTKAKSLFLPGELRIGAILVLGCIIYLFSSAMRDPEAFLHLPNLSRMEDRLLITCCITAGLSVLLLFRKWSWWRILIILIGLFATLGAGYEFITETAGVALYRDDHASFMHRLHIFGHNWPQQLYYDPSWNGGGAHSHIVLSGVNAPGLLGLPLWKYFPVHEVYTYGLATFFLVIHPIIFIVAIRMFGGSWTTALIGAALSVCSTRLFYKWALHFGTLGFSVTMPWLVLMSACIYRVLWRNLMGIGSALALILSTYLFLGWPAGSLMLPPLVLAILYSLPRFTWKKFLFLAGCAIVVILLLLPNVSAVLNHSRLAQLSEMQQATLSFGDIWSQGLALLPAELRRINPLVLWLGIIGVFFIKQPGLKGYMVVLIVGFVLMFAFGSRVKPQFELLRAAVPLAYLAVIPTAIWITRFLTDKSPNSAFPAAFCVAAMFLGAWTGTDYYGNHKDMSVSPTEHNKSNPPEYFTTMYPYLDDLKAELVEHVPEDARVLFLDGSDIVYGRGHIAYLPIYCGREMMASDYYHFPPALVDPRYPDPVWRKSGNALRNFCGIYNITHIIMFPRTKDPAQDGNLQFLTTYPNHFKKVFDFGTDARKFLGWEVLPDPTQPASTGLFAQGTGTVKSDIGRITVTLDDPNAPAVIRYNWEPGLQSSGKAVLTPHTMWNDATFIGIEPNGESTIEIRYKKWK